MALPHLTFSLYVYRLGFYQHLGATLKFARRLIFDTYQGVYYTGLTKPKDCPTCVTQESYKGTLTDITEANWNPSYSFTIPTNWLSGLYFFIVSPGAQGPEDGWVVPVVIRDPVNSNPHHADFVMIYPVATAQAYNSWGGTNLYSDQRQQDGADPARAYAVSFNRPLSESDGLPTLLEGYQMARFLEQNGYNVTYTTDVAVSAGLTNLLSYKGIIVAGHWEYVDWNERQAIQNAVDAGRSFFALSGNNMYWQVRYDTGTTGAPDSTIRCYKDWTKDPVFGNLSTDLWRNYPVNLPEDILLKELYQHDASTQNTNFWVTNAASWPYQGTGVSDGALAPAANIIGPEGDQTSPDSWTSDDHITILGSSPFVSGANTHMIATLLDELYTPSYHIVFDAGTILWTQALSDYTFPAFITVWQNPIAPSPTLERMMNNMLRRVLQGSAPGVR